MQKNFIGNLECSWQSPFDFSRHSSIGCGGKAKIAFYPQSVEELIALTERLRAEEEPYLVLGNLTNVLPADEGYEGAVIRTTKLDGVARNGGLFVYAGTSSGAFLRVCKQAKLTGGEFLEGVPCTMGGALYMNAGAGGRYIAELVERVLVLREGKRVSIPVKECAYAYKQSAFMRSGDIILGAELRLTESDGAQIERQIERYRQRRAHLPKGKSMGCVFKNPEKGFAGDLIERSGLKGMRVGGAVISKEHANFILNERNATAGDIRALIALIKNAVRAQYGIELQEEIRYVGKEKDDFNG